MTIAEDWRKIKPKNFKNIEEYLTFIEYFDPEAVFQKTDLGAVIIFSDGSQHRMGS